MECKEVQERVWERTAGALTDAEKAAFDSHLNVCASCRKVAEADRRLSEALAGLPGADVRVPSWAQVKAAHSARPRRTLRLWLAPAMASATALGVATWMVFSGSPGATTRDEAVAMTDSVFGEAHMMLAASDQTGDPNRVISWMYEAQDAR